MRDITFKPTLEILEDRYTPSTSPTAAPAIVTANTNAALVGSVSTAATVAQLTTSLTTQAAAPGLNANGAATVALANTVKQIAPSALTQLSDQVFTNPASQPKGIYQSNPYLAITGGGGDETDYAAPWYLPLG